MMGMEAEIIITKTDIIQDEEELSNLISLYRGIGYRVWPVSIIDENGFADFQVADRHGVWVLVGESGAGKSSLIKAILPHEDIAVQELSRIGRGQQTTRWVRLLKMRDYWVADTPGYTALETVVSNAAIIRNAFWEWEDAACRFTSCLHLDEPGCNVRAGMDTGRYNLQRYAHYKTMLGQWLKHY
jgi:ribosome biogenesis GTPase